MWLCLAKPCWLQRGCIVSKKTAPSNWCVVPSQLPLCWLRSTALGRPHALITVSKATPTWQCRFHAVLVPRHLPCPSKGFLRDGCLLRVAATILSPGWKYAQSLEMAESRVLGHYPNQRSCWLAHSPRKNRGDLLSSTPSEQSNGQRSHIQSVAELGLESEPPVF